MAKVYILTDITRKIGNRNHSWIYELTWLDPDDLTIYTMVVDESYRNYLKWDYIIANEQLGIYGNLRRRTGQDKDGLPIMDADSTPQLHYQLTAAEIVTYVESKHK